MVATRREFLKSCGITAGALLTGVGFPGKLNGQSPAIHAIKDVRRANKVNTIYCDKLPFHVMGINSDELSWVGVKKFNKGEIEYDVFVKK